MIRPSLLLIVAVSCSALASSALAGDPVTNRGMPRSRPPARATARTDATFTSYSSLTTFTSAAGTTDKITFTDLSNGVYVTTQYTVGKGVTFNDGNDSIYTYTGFSDGLGVNGNGRISITFKTPMAAVGADFPGGMTIDVYDLPGGKLLYTSSNFGSAGTGFFGGVTGDTTFTYVVLRDWVDDTVYIDNLYFGQGACSKDVDGDGSSSCLDCNDADASIKPGATEVAGDGIDQNCDGKETCYVDVDGDGYRPDATSTVVSSDADCKDTGEATSTAPTGDCNDASAAIKPGAVESCNGLDDNCNGQIDEGVSSTWYADADKDGYGDPGKPIQACSAPAGYVSQAGDCDDTKASTYPGAIELCNKVDDNCDGQIDEGVATSFYADADKDGYGNPGASTKACSAPTGYVTDNTDCDDTSAAVHPGALEACNNLDDNCNGQIDEGVKGFFYADADQDGYGNPAASTQACSAPTGYVADNTDCDDTNARVHPGVNESCNGVDDNCNGQIDEGVKSTFYADQDGDHYGNAASSQQACAAPAGYVADNTDCDDTQASIHPGALETCNGADDDCDSQVDEGVMSTYYPDTDGDGYGAGVPTQACGRPAGYVPAPSSPDRFDCNDGDSSIHPGAVEVCDGVDQNCDGQIDEGVLSTFHVDADGDGYGAAQGAIQACTAPEGYVQDGSDCDDSSAAVNPGQVEQAGQCDDGIDQDCNGQDLGCSGADQDGDGYSPVQGDCNDSDGQINPGAAEVCDGIDNDCDGQIDGLDQDGDGVSPCPDGVWCTDVEEGAECTEVDCDDADPVVYGGADEACDGRDNDCNGAVDDRDIDQDGEIDEACAGDDCNDLDGNVNPGAMEVCDAIDNDCDGVVDDVDQDGDGYQSEACAAGGSTATDCNDADASIHPGAAEVEDGVDNDCDGVVDGGEASPTPGGETPDVSPTPGGETPDVSPTPGDGTPGVSPTPGGETPGVSPTPGDGTPGGDASPTPDGSDGGGSSGCDCSTTGRAGTDGSGSGGTEGGSSRGRSTLPAGTALLFLAALAIQRRRMR